MHHAPAVCYPVGRSRFHLVLLILLGGLGVFALFGWIGTQDPLSWRHATSWVVWSVAATLAGWAWWASPLGELAYGGDGWTWTQPGRVNVVSVRAELDLQQTLLLRVAQPAHPPLWLWLEHRRSPIRWQALRCAVFAPVSAAVAPAEHGSPA